MGCRFHSSLSGTEATGINGLVIPRQFYSGTDVTAIARKLLGKLLYTSIGGVTVSGIIIETEAYAGVTDRASHAYGGKRTDRTRVMYMQGGTAYVYLCYGVHSLFNIVTAPEGIPHAILVRGILPYLGIEDMAYRNGTASLTPKNASGPGRVARLLGIHYLHSGLDLCHPDHSTGSDAIWLQDQGIDVPADQIQAGPRIGIDYAGADALLPYRFVWVQNNKAPSGDGALSTE